MRARAGAVEVIPVIPVVAVTLAQAGATLSIGVEQIRTMVRSGELPVAYFGKCPRVLITDLQRVAEQRATARADALHAEQEIVRRQREMVPPGLRNRRERRQSA